MHEEIKIDIWVDSRKVRPQAEQWGDSLRRRTTAMPDSPGPTLHVVAVECLGNRTSKPLPIASMELMGSFGVRQPC